MGREENSEIKEGFLNKAAEESKVAFDAEASFQTFNRLIEELESSLHSVMPQNESVRQSQLAIKRYLEKMKFARHKGRITHDTIQELIETTRNFLDTVKKNREILLNPNSEEKIDNETINVNQKKLEEIVREPILINPHKLTSEHAKLLEEYFATQEKKSISKNKAYGDDDNFYRHGSVNFYFKHPLVRIKKIYEHIKFVDTLPENKDADTLYVVKAEDGGAVVFSFQEEPKILTADKVKKHAFLLGNQNISDRKQIQALMRECDYPITYMYQTFKKKKVLGRGGFGIVYESEGRLESLKGVMEYKPFAEAQIQVMKVQEVADEDENRNVKKVERVKQEAVIWKTLDETAKEENLPLSQTKKPTSQKSKGRVRKMYMPQRKIHGTPLHELDSHNLSNEKLYAITIELLKALRRIHKAGFVHRDIKPDNVIVDLHTTPVTVTILDVGLTVKQNDPAENAGSRRYLPPELYADAVPRADVTHDFYSLGNLLRKLWVDEAIDNKNSMLKTSDEIAAYLKAEYWLDISTSRANLNYQLDRSNIRAFSDASRWEKDAQLLRDKRSLLEGVLSEMTVTTPENRMSAAQALNLLEPSLGPELKEDLDKEAADNAVKKQNIDPRSTGFGAEISLISIAANTTVDKVHLEAAEKYNTPLIIKLKKAVGEDCQYFIYSKPEDASTWQQTEITSHSKDLEGLSRAFMASEQHQWRIALFTYTHPHRFTTSLRKMIMENHDHLGEYLDKLNINNKLQLLDELIENIKEVIPSPSSYLQEYLHLLTVAIEHKKIPDENLNKVILLTRQVLQCVNVKGDENNVGKHHVVDLTKKVMTYSLFVKKSWQQTYLPNKTPEEIKNTNFAEYFLGWPKQNGVVAKGAYLFTLGWIFTPIKNTVKWVAEFAPKFLSGVFDFLNFQVAKTNPTDNVLKEMRTGFSYVFKGASLLFGAVNLLTRTVTSPITSWRAAKQRGGLPLAMLSGACSAAGFVALSVIALPAAIGVVATAAPQLGIAGVLQMLGSPFAGFSGVLQTLAPGVTSVLGVTQALGAAAISIAANLCFLGNGVRENSTEKALINSPKPKEVAVEDKKAPVEKRQKHSTLKIAKSLRKDEQSVQLSATFIEKKKVEAPQIATNVDHATNANQYTPQAVPEPVMDLSRNRSHSR